MHKKLFFVSESRRSYTLISFEQLAEIACRAEARCGGYLLDGHIGTRKQLLCFLYAAFCDVFHRAGVKGLSEKQAQILL